MSSNPQDLSHSHPHPHSPSPSPSLPSDSHHSSASYLSYPVSHVVNGLYRRLTDKDPRQPRKKSSRAADPSPSTSSSSPVFTPVRTASPFQPPPLTPLTLSNDSPSLQQQLLSRALAEEIRLLVPARLQLVDTWRLAYSLDRDGASLGTLYDTCHQFSLRSPRAGYVLVVRDSSPAGAVFGAYMTDPPHPATHYYATGECFLWRSSVLPPPQSVLPPPPPPPTQESTPVREPQGPASPPPSHDLLELAGLPPPPSADTTHAGRSTTLRGDKKKSSEAASDTSSEQARNGNLLAPSAPPPQPQSNDTGAGAGTGTSTPERIRFKAFPYSGVNDYMMFCETGFLSLGGG